MIAMHTMMMVVARWEQCIRWWWWRSESCGCELSQQGITPGSLSCKRHQSAEDHHLYDHYQVVLITMITTSMLSPTFNSQYAIPYLWKRCHTPNTHTMGKICSSNLIYIEDKESHSQTHTIDIGLFVLRQRHYNALYEDTDLTVTKFRFGSTHPLYTCKHWDRNTDLLTMYPRIQSTLGGWDLIWNLMTTSVHFVIFQPL